MIKDVWKFPGGSGWSLSSIHWSSFTLFNMLTLLFHSTADLGEDIHRTATREVFEETGVKAGKHSTWLLDVHQTTSICNTGGVNFKNSDRSSPSVSNTTTLEPTDVQISTSFAVSNRSATSWTRARARSNLAVGSILTTCAHTTRVWWLSASLGWSDTVRLTVSTRSIWRSTRCHP